MDILRYMAISATCLSFAYATYLLIARKERNFKQLRLFLLGIIALSILIPVSNLRINIGFQFPSHTVHDNITSPKQVDDLPEEETIVAFTNTVSSAESSSPEYKRKINVLPILKMGYLFVALFLVLRLFFQVAKMLYYYSRAEKEYDKTFRLAYSPDIKHAFSFFRLIFIPKEHEFDINEKEKIIAHEKIHVSQYHSIDILLIELLAAVMWFNPLVWMMRNSIQLVHEYLADEGALGTGIDKLKYQALLLNQVAEERLICLSSSFNHSLIKKRMIMMTKSKFYQQSKLKILVLIPVAAFLFLGVACVKGQDKEHLVKKAPPPKDGEIVTAVAPLRMNVLYLGVDNPVAIASSGYKASELEVSISNGEISGSNGNYIANPALPGNAFIEIKHNGKVIQSNEFRVKSVPDPVAEIAGRRSGEISKSDLLNAGKITVSMKNFDFDLEFKVTRFLLSGVLVGFVQEFPTKGDLFTDLQIAFINKLNSGDKITFSNIYAVGPDGVERELNPIIFRLSDK